ncbi:DUF4270 domain-containing protein [Paradesertivirga mongoliensis]|uniref:DUF4270 domain-containing protein n=1 Tax=Paradesertivirga mongoliensis TaxID=2100740 RepID=A0ABW4ZH85_9SPHI|nr:DUF4270 domain-containing protein [Pedobacter mongoliensis]
MKYFKLDLLTLLVSLFIFSSCEKDGTIGLDIAPQDSIKSIFTDTATVNTLTVAEDSIITSGIAQNAFGYLKDPIFGTTEANLALGLSLPSENYSFGSNPTLDSAVLVLKYGDEFYGDSISSKYVINVHQLQKTFNSAASYSNRANFEYDGTGIVGELGRINEVRAFKWNDSTLINGIIKGAPDKPTMVAPQLRIPLKSTFINDNFINADPSKLKTNAAFSNFIKGLFVTISKSESTGNGGIVFFNLQPANVTGLEIYYKTLTGTVKDTLVAKFGVNGASQIKHDYTGTPIKTQIDNPSQSYSTVYVQPLAGVRTKLKFPHIKGLASKGKISINKAELVIPVIAGTYNALKPAPRLTLYRTDIAGQRRPVPDNAINQDPRFLDERTFGGFYNATDKTYTFNITSYIQDLVTREKVIQYDTYIAPIDLPFTGQANVFPSAVTAARSVLGGKGNADSPIKLKITYTKPN